ncbi:hypothetical protein ACLOJK_017303 [Asimina triloba]
MNGGRWTAAKADTRADDVVFNATDDNLKNQLGFPLLPVESGANVCCRSLMQIA